MKLVPIPPNTKRQSKREDKERDIWWRVHHDKLPELAILARSTGRGTVRKGLIVYLISGHDRDVFLGENCEKFKLHEYVGLVNGTGWQPLVQLGRDVEMVDE